MRPIYRHYKSGKLYEHIGGATHSETGEALTLYKSIESGLIWARPTEMFFEKVTNAAGEIVQRFQRVDSET